MTPEEALAVLDNAASLATLNRSDHVTVQMATDVLREALKKEEVKDVDKKLQQKT